ncbi:hypothetical protein [Mobiluncus mulieris]|uniref:hypothetical protein n=1 Tax=Mobiluncus mulieris TaxID=2052 RepID=UPI000E08745F|nr:hypothetical protein [Mobiluncus mulieris]STY85318.1 Uncharacterised protein [Mobiluncus mulieris]
MAIVARLLGGGVAKISEYFGFAGKIPSKSRFFHSFLPGCLGLAGGHEVPSGVADDVPGLRVRQVEVSQVLFRFLYGC